MNYQRELEQIIKREQAKECLPRLLLHSCCAPCSSYCLQEVAPTLQTTVFYYNPNLDCAEEYEKAKGRADSFFCGKRDLPIFSIAIILPKRLPKSRAGWKGKKRAARDVLNVLRSA